MQQAQWICAVFRRNSKKLQNRSLFPAEKKNLRQHFWAAGVCMPPALQERYFRSPEVESLPRAHPAMHGMPAALMTNSAKLTAKFGASYHI